MFYRDDLLTDTDKEKLRAFKLTKKVKASEVVSVDDFEMPVYSPIEYCEMTDDEIQANKGNVLFADVESYPDYFLAAFKLIGSHKHITFEDYDGCSPIDCRKLLWILQNYTIVGYNSKIYDMPMLARAVKGNRHKYLYEVTKDIILMDTRLDWSDVKSGIAIPNVKHIDLIEVAPLQGSLKLYAGRLHCKRMQSLPYEPSERLGPDKRKHVFDYCLGDLDNTELLAAECGPALKLRKDMSGMYGLDLMSKSDAQVAEAVIVSELKRFNGYEIKKPVFNPDARYKFRIPSFVQYRHPALKEMLDIVRKAIFKLDGGGGVVMPEEIKKLHIIFGHCIYQMGIGGLHSTEKSCFHVTDENVFLADCDVVSYYPAIILNQELYPKHLGKVFLQIYKAIVDRRIESKILANQYIDDIQLAKLSDTLKAKFRFIRSDKYESLFSKEERANYKTIADSLKITVNGSFGKFGNLWSNLYAPDLMLQVTMSGQLCLFMLIEMLEEAGIPVVSANTDGVMVKCPGSHQGALDATIAAWQALTGFETERELYKAVYSRDVNNYIAIAQSGKVKVKGAFSDRGSAGNSPLSRNPEAFVCNDAVIEFLTKQTPLEESIRNCGNLTRFVTVRNVKGGAVKSGHYLGKTVRWYYSTQMKGQIEYLSTGNKVPLSDGAMPLMELPTNIPSDLDYQKYIDRANEILFDIGFYQREKATRGKRGLTQYELLF